MNAGGPRLAAATVIGALVLSAGVAVADLGELGLAGSLQLDYLAVPTEHFPRDSTLDGATAELSLKLTREIGKHASASVKVCFACHGFEAAMAFVDLRASDELVLRIGRMTPELGAFPQRHDPANHHTSDKPLIYDMGRMLRLRDWNEGVLPAPWVDNGVELHGTHFFGRGRVDYAAYATSGPKASSDAVDFDFTMSRSPSQYYVDNNSEPVVGGRLAGSVELGDDVTVAVGASAMAGHYDPERRLGFVLAGADLVAQVGRAVVRAEYLRDQVEMSLGPDPAGRFKYGPGPGGRYDSTFVKDGAYVEGEVPVGRVDLVARWDLLRRRGNVLATSVLSSRAELLRYTLGGALRIDGDLRLKLSVELYDFRDLGREVALHIGIATPF